MSAHATVSVEDLHVCTKTSPKIVAELTLGGSKAMHALTFTEDGLVSDLVPYALVPCA